MIGPRSSSDTRHCEQGATWVSSLPMVNKGVPTGYSSLTGLGEPGKIGILWEFVCCPDQAPCGSPNEPANECSTNTNTTIVWSELPADF